MRNNCKLPHGKPQPDEKTFQTPETISRTFRAGFNAMRSME